MSSFLVRAAQRRTVRRSVRFNCQVVRERDFRLVAVRGIDLSPDGMLVECDHADVAAGDELIVSFNVPQTRWWFDSETRVTRVIEGRRPADDCRALGLRFLTLDGISRALVTAKLRGVPPPVPARSARVDYAGSVRRVFGSDAESVFEFVV